MELKKFFIEDNKSGYKTREVYLEKEYPELYIRITQYCSNNELSNVPFKQKIWHYINNINYKPKCLHCNKELKFKKSIKEGYGNYCSILCSNKCEERKLKIKITNNEKYGGNAPACSNNVKEKIRTTTQKNYGVDNVFKNIEFIEGKTFEKHGVEHISKLDSTKEKIKNTNLNKYGTSTPLTLIKVRQLGYEKKFNSFVKKYENLTLVDYTANTISFKCDVCDNNYDIDRSLLNYRHSIDINPCTLCSPVGVARSLKEGQICEFLDELSVDYIRNDRSIIGGLEIDIYLPKYNIGIEFNGLYWHSDYFKPIEYHVNKSNICNENGVKLIQVFEDEWDYKKDIVKSRIKNQLGFTDNKIFARNCEIRYVSTKIKTEFLNKNHIQGAVGSKINIGLYHNNNLVSLMTFGKKRKVLGNTTSKFGEFELLRFCNLLDHAVIGGASKLLKKFINDHKPLEIISYADRRWSDGNLYRKLDFNLIKNTPPNYFYVIGKKREHRFKFRKDILVRMGYDSNLTEYEIMKLRGINRIYDCGNLVFKQNFKH